MCVYSVCVFVWLYGFYSSFCCFMIGNDITWWKVSEKMDANSTIKRHRMGKKLRFDNNSIEKTDAAAASRPCRSIVRWTVINVSVKYDQTYPKEHTHKQLNIWSSFTVCKHVLSCPCRRPILLNSVHSIIDGWMLTCNVTPSPPQLSHSTLELHPELIYVSSRIHAHTFST